MIYSHTSKFLYTDTKQLIKQLNCSLAKSWNYLSLIDNDFVRYCGSCSKEVSDIPSLDERQMIAVVELFPEQCS
jgi:hypothetical protein